MDQEQQYIPEHDTDSNAQDQPKKRDLPPEKHFSQKKFSKQKREYRPHADGGHPRPHHPQQQHAPQQKGPAQQPKQTVDISVVIPLYNENESLRELADGLKRVLTPIAPRWEVFFIDDGSTDGSFQTLHELYKTDKRFKVIRFRRNCGKSAALSVGFRHARGEYVVTMDADLQDDPEEIPRLIEKVKSGVDLVSGWKKRRKDPLNKTLPSKFFNFVTGKLSGIKIHDFNCGLKGYKGDVIKSVQLYGEMHRYIPVLAKMAGFTVAEIPVTHHARKYGRTKFGASRFFKGFLDLLTVLFTSRYTQRPLHLFGTIGVLFAMIGIGINIYLSVEWLMGFPIGARPMLWLGILLIVVGMQSISTGLIAEMITKTNQGSITYPIKNILK